MSETGDCTELRETLHKRYEVLVALATEPQTKPQLVDTVGPSRSTIDRAISALEETGCIERINSKYHLTPVGRISHTEHERYRETMSAVSKGKDVLNALSDEARIDPVFLNGVDVQTANPHAPESALQSSITHLESTNRLVGLAPVVLSLYTDILTNLVKNNDFQTEIILNESTLDSLLGFYQDRFSAIGVTDHFTFYVTEHELPYALWIMERDEHPLAGITIYEKGGVRGVLMNDSPDAVAWARKEYEQYRDQARCVTVDLPQ